MKQHSLFKTKSEYHPNRISYGGVTKGRSKMSRPLNKKKPLHVVFKSSHAKGRMSLLGKKLKVDELLYKWASKCRVTVHRRENMGNHLHIMLSFKTKPEIQKFLRTFSGLVARMMTKAEKGKAFGKRFWDELVFTRIITGFKDRFGMNKYMNKNEVEREHGPVMREAMEMYDEVRRQARRRKVPLETIYEELLIKMD